MSETEKEIQTAKEIQRVLRDKILTEIERYKAWGLFNGDFACCCEKEFLAPCENDMRTCYEECWLGYIDSDGIVSKECTTSNNEEALYE